MLPLSRATLYISTTFEARWFETTLLSAGGGAALDLPGVALTKGGIQVTERLIDARPADDPVSQTGSVKLFCPASVTVDYHEVCFIANEFRRYCEGRGISVIYGTPYHPKGREKLERFHGTLTQELVGRHRFRSLAHFRQKLYGYRGRYNRTPLHGGIGWKLPNEVYHDPKLMNRERVRSP
jgi:hypothetical protein